MTTFRKCYLIPPNEKQCLWMSSGVVSYQLCDRMFDCDNCPMDQAMRRRFTAVAPSEEHRGHEVRAAEHEMPRDGYYYNRNHWWAQQTGPRLVRLGLEPGLARVLHEIKGIVFPAPKQPLRRGQACIWLVMDGGTMPLEAPLDGTVRAANDALTASPHLLGLHPFDEGWLLELETDDAESIAVEWMSAAEAEPRYRSDQSRFMTSITSTARTRRASGNRKQEVGSAQLRGFVDLLGSTRYFGIVRQHFGWIKR
jgi:glycine cleavage system H protein